MDITLDGITFQVGGTYFEGCEENTLLPGEPASFEIDSVRLGNVEICAWLFGNAPEAFKRLEELALGGQA